MNPDLMPNPFGGWLATKPSFMLIDDGLLPDDFSSKYDSKHHLELGRAKHKWYARGRKDFVKFGAYLCRLNFRQNFNTDQRRPQSREPLWADIALCFYCYCTVKMMISVYLHYCFEYQNHVLNKFDQLVERLHGGALTPVQAHHRQLLVEQCEQARSSYKALGAPFMHLGHAVTVGFVYYIIVAYAAYIFPQLYYKFQRPFDYSIIYTMIAPHRLQKSLDSVICEVVNSFIVSSKTYNRLLIEQRTCDLVFLRRYWCKASRLELGLFDDRDLYYVGASDHCDQHYCEDVSMSEANSIRQVLSNDISHNHQFFVRQVKFMALNGWFQPFNRRQRWLAKIGELYGLTLVCLILYGFSCLVVFTSTLPLLGVLEFGFECDPKDLLFHAEIWLLGFMASTVSGFYITLTAMICLDQAHGVAELIKLIDNCIATNTFKLRGYSDTDGAYRPTRHRLEYLGLSGDNQAILRPASSSAARKPTGPLHRSSTALGERQIASLLSTNNLYLLDESINLNLMHTLLHYRVYVRQFRPALDTLPVSATTITFVMFLPVIISRLLLAYLASWQKTIILLVCLLIVVTTACVLSMICWLHSRCLDIDGHLQSLMAHTIAMNHAVRLSTGREAYDNHLTWMLHRELSHPEKLVNRYAPPLLGLQSRMTYAFLLKCLFWWGLIAISIIRIDPNGPMTTDLFGYVWQYYRQADTYAARLLGKAQAS